MDHVLTKPKSIFKIATTKIEKRVDKGFKGRSRIIWTHIFQDFCTYLYMFASIEVLSVTFSIFSKEPC